MSFNILGLSAEILRAITEKGYTHSTPIQQQAIPVILQRRDIMAGAQTGTGKTAAFALPLLHLLHSSKLSGKNRQHPVRALILTPTRELANQIGENVREYGKYLDLRSTVIFGGTSIHHQIKKLRSQMDILVATPGRLLDHARQKTVHLSEVEILVLDEADRMLDMGFIPDVRKIISLLPKQRQNLLFFATFSQEIVKLAHGFLKSPVLIEVTQRNTVSEHVVQVVHPVDRARKHELLSFLIGSKNWKQILVFTRTKHSANRLTRQLIQNGLSTVAIHGDKSQGTRMKALSNFKKGSVRILVATNVASRGLDIKQLPHVINYELPEEPEDYIHRIGRTGRAGKKGDAISLVCVDELTLLKKIEQSLKCNIPRITIPGYSPDPSIKPVPIRNKRVSFSQTEKHFQSKQKHIHCSRRKHSHSGNKKH